MLTLQYLISGQNCLEKRTWQLLDRLVYGRLFFLGEGRILRLMKGKNLLAVEEVVGQYHRYHHYIHNRPYEDNDI